MNGILVLPMLICTSVEAVCSMMQESLGGRCTMGKDKKINGLIYKRAF